jgi:branched-chain amino acid transport system ATP-binding protein
MTTPTQPILATSEISAGYGQAEVLHRVDLTLGEGEVVALMGANGAGKTSLLKVIMGLLRTNSGDIRLRGERILGLSPTEICRRGVALVPEGRGVFASQSVESNLIAAAWAVGGRSRDLRNRAGKIYERFPLLGQRRALRAGTLSGGEARILSIAMALMLQPQVLLLDEPSLGLAPMMIDSVLDVVEELRDEGKAILLVEQNAQAALAVASAAHLLHLGRIVASGPAEELAHHEDLQEAYLGAGTSKEGKQR